MMTLLVSLHERADLKQAYQHIAKDNVQAADRVLARIVEVIGMLASGMVDGREVVLRDGRRVQTWPVSLIYYIGKSKFQFG